MKLMCGDCIEKMKVFCREKYLRVMDKIAPDLAEERRGYKWSFACEGKTEEECNALGYVVRPNWMEEKKYETDFR